MPIYGHGLEFASGPQGIFQDAPYSAKYEDYPSFGRAPMYFQSDFTPPPAPPEPADLMAARSDFGQAPDEGKKSTWGLLVVGAVALLVIGMFLKTGSVGRQ